MRTTNDNELLLSCRRVHQGLAAICCALIVASITLQFGDTLARVLA
ncbi:hypothetical protein GY166_30615 [Burkholderia multivorans]|nr:hypothetical protein [Burkholderia multivorans]MBN8173518.1 hypothetical protein [Burkholderia multivorans]